jgi:hypothetical protein
VIRARSSHDEADTPPRRRCPVAPQQKKKQIGESLRRFGIADDTTDVLVALFGPKGGDPAAALAPAVALLERDQQQQQEEGAAAAPTPPTLEQRLARLFDAPLAARYYHVVPAELRVGSMDDAIACRVGGMECL